MRYIAEVDRRDWESHVHKLVAINGWQTWKRRAEQLIDQCSFNPYLDTYISQVHGVELSLYFWKRHKRLHDRFPQFGHDVELQRLATFATGIVQTFNALSDKGKHSLKGRIAQGLQCETRIPSLASELLVGVTLSRHGFDLSLSDLEGESRFDFLATKSSAEFEVECKTINADIGRRIRHRDFRLFANEVASAFFERLDRLPGTGILHLAIPGELGKHRPVHQCLAALVKKALRSGIRENDDQGASAEFDGVDLPAYLFSTASSGTASPLLKEYLQQATGREIRQAIFFRRQNKGALGISLTSERSDSVVEAVYKRLRTETKNQFTGSKPALLVVQLIDIDSPGMKRIVTAHRNVLQQMTQELFERRPHLTRIEYLSGDEMRTGGALVGNRRHTISTLAGTSYTFDNPNNRAFADCIASP